MSANIPPHTPISNLSPEQQRELGEELDHLGVHIDPKELKSMNMSQLQKKLVAAGKPEAFEKVKSVMKSFSEGSVQSMPKVGSKLKLSPQMEVGLKNLFNKAFGAKEGPIKFQEFVHKVQEEHPDGNLPTGADMKKAIESYLTQHHVPQVEAENLADNVVKGESEGGLGSTSSGGAETE